ncbi:30S ribosomal protein S6e [Methanosarcinales archaeon]|nr:MAG: 30S ribosomal protein S6e [Methanosarcinales archaeon]
MAEFKVIVSDPRSGRAYQITVSGAKADTLIGKRIGDEFSGDVVGLSGYILKITGGTDKDGFPMRPDLSGPQRRKILVSGGVGYKPKKKGVRRRKTFRGNEISADIVQVNVVVSKSGATPIDKLLGIEKESENEEVEKPSED